MKRWMAVSGLTRRMLERVKTETLMRGDATELFGERHLENNYKGLSAAMVHNLSHCPFV